MRKPCPGAYTGVFIVHTSEERRVTARRFEDTETLRLHPWRLLQPSNQGTRNNLPYYLWDKEGKCTVETAQLNLRPLYAVISHTWGRWRS